MRLTPFSTRRSRRKSAVSLAIWSSSPRPRLGETRKRLSTRWPFLAWKRQERPRGPLSASPRRSLLDRELSLAAPGEADDQRHAQERRRGDSCADSSVLPVEAAAANRRSHRRFVRCVVVRGRLIPHAVGLHALQPLVALGHGLEPQPVGLEPL